MQGMQPRRCALFALVVFTALAGALAVRADPPAQAAAGFHLLASSLTIDAKTQPDGKILVLGLTGDCLHPGLDCGGGRLFLIRLTRSGKPDPTFDEGRGPVAVGTGPSGSLTVDSEGRLLVASGGTNLNAAMLHRFTPDGASDSSFGSDGVVGIGGSVVLQPDEKILVFHGAISRLDTDGKPDPSWGENGSVPGPAYEGTVADNGDVVAVEGYSRARRVALARYLPNGTPDPSFGGDGVSDPVELYDRGYPSDGNTVSGLLTTPSGDIFAAGTEQQPKSAPPFLAHWSPDGTFIRQLPDPCGGLLAMAPDGSILEAGGSTGLAAYYEGPPFTSTCLHRRNSAGDVIASAGGGGTGYFALPTEVRPDGVALVGGAWFGDRYESSRAILRRYSVNGSLDTGFGQGGPFYYPLFRCMGQPATEVATADNHRPKGTAHRDVIVGLGPDDRLNGRGGNDLICGGAGADKLFGGPGRDRLFGQAGPDRLAGGPGRDRQVGGAGMDVVVGAPGPG